MVVVLSGFSVLRLGDEYLVAEYACLIHLELIGCSNEKSVLNC